MGRRVASGLCVESGAGVDVNTWEATELKMTVGSDIACHALGMVFDPGINFSMDSAPSDFHPHPDISFSPFIS